jgi:Skp family chaperone for outer membrane proteins
VKRNTFVMLATLALAYQSPLTAQEAAPAAPAADRSPSRVGLIDMAMVFEGYDKFKVLRDELSAEIEKSDAEAKVMVERMQQKQKDLQESGLQPGSPEYEQAERGLLDAKGEFESFRAATQRRLARRESDMFKVIYADASGMVQRYAEHVGYTVVIRFDSKGIEDETAPAEAVQRMNKQVVYHRPENDITKIVLSALNREYASRRTATPARAASSAAPARN